MKGARISCAYTPEGLSPTPVSSMLHHLTNSRRRSSMSVERDIRFDLIARLCPNTTGAELRSVATEAGMFAIRARRKVATERDFLDAVEKVVRQGTKFSSTYVPRLLFLWYIWLIWSAGLDLYTRCTTKSGGRCVWRTVRATVVYHIRNVICFFKSGERLSSGAQGQQKKWLIGIAIIVDLFLETVLSTNLFL